MRVCARVCVCVCVCVAFTVEVLRCNSIHRLARGPEGEGRS